MTPPTVEYWRVWSDSADRWDMDGNHASEFESIESAQREASAKNALTYSRHTDWRPVRVRETVVDDRQPLAANSLADVYAENAALTEALKTARMHHEASANIANADKAALRARVSELEAQLAERTDTLRTFQIVPREPFT